MTDIEGRIIYFDPCSLSESLTGEFFIPLFLKYMLVEGGQRGRSDVCVVPKSQTTENPEDLGSVCYDPAHVVGRVSSRVQDPTVTLQVYPPVLGINDFDQVVVVEALLVQAARFSKKLKLEIPIQVGKRMNQEMFRVLSRWENKDIRLQEIIEQLKNLK